MTLLFEGLSFVQRMVLVLEIAAVIGGIIFLIFRMVAHKKVSFNMTKGQLSYAPDSEDSDVVHNVANGVFFQTLETVAMMTQIKTKLILHDQMSYLEEKLVIIKDTILGAYRQAWKDYTTENPGAFEASGNQEYLFYQSLAALMKEDMKSSVRVFFIRNHFSTYDDQQLTSYINEKNELLLVKAYQFLRDMYPVDRMTLPLDSIVTCLDDVKPDLESCLRTAFKRAGHITLERHKQISSLETGLRNRIKKTYGVDLGSEGGDIFSGALTKSVEVATYD